MGNTAALGKKKLGRGLKGDLEVLTDKIDQAEN